MQEQSSGGSSRGCYFIDSETEAQRREGQARGGSFEGWVWQAPACAPWVETQKNETRAVVFAASAYRPPPISSWSDFSRTLVVLATPQRP
jgi:hypothetical protein